MCHFSRFHLSDIIWYLSLPGLLHLVGYSMSIHVAAKGITSFFLWLSNISFYVYAIVVQLLSHVRLFATPWTAASHASWSFTISWSLLKLMSIESMMPFNHLILCLPLFSCPKSFPALESFPVSQFFASGSQSTGASVSVLPMNIQN